ncbi:unnamed protein product [Phytophthora fragariaefolia]|uniref:Unnamed protein product n=1 Tax=Phytophthora fragariaefolia TaxID=1490495 RepID=A0A9W6YHN9_9STRA|nr:unnamed protein product [Phytophthora fragariaefolia]
MPLFDDFQEFIGQPVRVLLQDSTSTVGVLYCIDPETDHVALLCPTAQHDSGSSVKILLGHHVRSIEKESHDSSDLPTLAALQDEFREQVSEDQVLDDAASIHLRREKLGQFLTKVRELQVAACNTKS